MNKDEFVLAVFEIAFGHEARPPDMALPEDHTAYRMPFSYEEALEEIERINKVAYEAVENLTSDEKVSIFLKIMKQNDFDETI